jgi:glycine/D-amino acid oxidase-like deaminating enzyme
VDVIVIGAGVTGLSTALHLAAHGQTRVAVSSYPAALAATSLSAGLLAGGQSDNFTRFSHALGAAAAARLWGFGAAAFAATVAFLREKRVPHRLGRRLRLATSEAEVTEMGIAVEQLLAAGFAARLTRRGEAADGLDWATLGSRILAVQEEGTRAGEPAAREAAGFVAPEALMSALLTATAAVPRVDAVAALREVGAKGRDAGVEAALVTGEIVRAEIAVLAAHLGSVALVPELTDALVPYADQWTEVAAVPARGRAASAPGLEAGCVFSATHGHEWGVSRGEAGIRIGGARYLRPMAGIEAKTADAPPRVTAQLLSLAQGTLPSLARVRAVRSVALREIRPCDEVPLIGPSFGSGRVLVAAGYMGQGLTQGFLAGRALADLINTGKARDLPRELWPTRLRSLST